MTDDKNGAIGTIVDDLIEDVVLKFNNCGLAVHAPGWTERKKHPDYDLWYVTSGQIAFECGGMSRNAVEGDVVFFHPGVSYTAASPLAACSHIFIHFELPLGRRSDFLDEFDLMGVLPHREFEAEGTMFRETFDAYRNKEPLSALKLKGYFLVLLAKLLGISQDRRAPRRETEERMQRLGRLKPVLELMEEQIGDNIPAERLAGMIGMSTKYFYAYFKNNIGLTPHHYLTRIRMKRARDMLRERKLSVKEIAYRLGFSDPYAFSKIFKRLHNVSPSRYWDHT